MIGLGLAGLVVGLLAGVATGAPAGGFDLQVLRPDLTPMGFTAVDVAVPLPRLTPSLRALATYSRDPLVLDGADGVRLGSLVRDRMDVAIVGGLGLVGGADLAVGLPVVAVQAGDLTPTEGGYRRAAVLESGLGDPWVRMRAGLLNTERHGIDMAFAALITVPLAVGAGYSGNRAASVAPELVVSREIWRILIAVNAGYRWAPGQGANAPREHQLAWRAGAGILLDVLTPRDLRLGLEAFGSTELTAPFARREDSPSELLFAARWQVGSGIAIDAGFGGGIVAGVGAPLVRTVLGLSWALDRTPPPAPPVAPILPEPPREKTEVQVEAIFGDADQDGIADDADRCPGDPEDHDGVQDEDGCPDDDATQDRDNDGLADVADACPTEPEDIDEWADGDGCPEPDNDADGLADHADKCPNHPETQNGFQDEDGCPDEQNEDMTLTGDGFEVDTVVFFVVDSAELKPRATKVLDAIVRAMREHPEIKTILIEGHTDAYGSARANMRLSRRRAEQVRLYLIRHGVESRRILAFGYGEAQASPGAPKPRLERRVQFQILERWFTDSAGATGSTPAAAAPTVAPGVQPTGAADLGPEGNAPSPDGSGSGSSLGPDSDPGAPSR